ncbi:hypothetical protein B0H14DRAFT_2729094 [Mycena olivaceomarginata]|nr:hypothetical protein B0H14DRAFT_2729094 [Mycena olivaceomarginata]
MEISCRSGILVHSLAMLATAARQHPSMIPDLVDFCSRPAKGSAESGESVVEQPIIKPRCLKNPLETQYLPGVA